MNSQNLNPLVEVYKNVFSQNTPESTSSISTLINKIQSCEETKNRIKELREAPTDQEKDRLKKKLEAFRTCVSVPCQEPYETNGVIQLDVDVYDFEKSASLKKVLAEKIPSLLYAFISPKGGLKFSVLSDLVGKDKYAYKEAYYLTVDHVKEILGDDCPPKFDDHCASLSLNCPISSDHEAYFSNNPQILKLSGRVEALIKEKTIEEEKKREERLKASSDNPTYNKPEDQDVLNALAVIPTNCEYKERLPINFAVFDHFGAEGISILLNYWRVDNPKKLNSDLNAQFKSHTKRGGSRYTVATLFAEALKLGYRPPPPRNTEKAEDKGKEPTYSVSKLYSSDEASLELERIIEEFIETWKDTAVLFEAGAGKTWGSIKKLNEELLKRKRQLKVAYFVNSRAIAEERKTEMVVGDEEQERLVDVLKIIEKAGGGVSIIKGYGEDTCPLFKKGEIYSGERCDKCNYYHVYERHCPYKHQYLGDYKARIDHFRLYQHAHLFQPSRLDRIDPVWTPDLIVVDEDVVSNMIEKEYVKKGTSFPVIDLIIENLLESGCTGIADIVRSYENQLKADRRKLLQGKKIEELDKLDKAIFEVIRVLLMYAKSSAIPSASLWVEDNNYLYVGWVKQIDDKWADVPMLYLDASGNEKIISRVLDKEFKFHRIRCEYQPYVRVIQVQNNMASKGWCKDNRDKIQSLIELIEKKPNADNTGFISYKNVKSKTFISDLVTDQDRCGWFGNLRGSNQFKGSSQLIVIGRHFIPSEEMIRIAKIVYRNWDDNWADFMGDEFEAKPFSDVMRMVEKTVRMKDGHHKTLKTKQYLDSRLHELSEHLNQSETYQAIHRLRLVHGIERKQLVYVSKDVNDITVDRLVDDKAVFITGTRREFVETVFANNGKIKLSSNKQIAELMGKEVRAIAKMKENNGEWMRNNIFFHVDADGYCVAN